MFATWLMLAAALMCKTKAPFRVPVGPGNLVLSAVVVNRAAPGMPFSHVQTGDQIPTPHLHRSVSLLH